MIVTSRSTEANLDCCREAVVTKGHRLPLKTLPQLTTAFLTNSGAPPLTMVAKDSHAGALTPSKKFSQRSTDLPDSRAQSLML